jgi:hypothetical protein
MFSTRIRTTIITLIAAGSFGSATLVPVAAQAKAPEKQRSLETLGYTCEHTGEHFTTCTDKNGNEWYCDEQADECSQVKFGKKTTNATTVASSPVLASLAGRVAVIAHR